MFSYKMSSEKTGLLMFFISLSLGLAIFLLFGFLGGVFASEEGFLTAVTSSPLGFIALFGLTLILASPLIGLSVWLYDRAIRSEMERQEKKNKNKRP